MNRFEAVRKFARRIADRFDLTPPIDVSNIFSEMDIQIVEEENQYGIEAYSQLNDNKVIINTEITYIPRRRFTLAHELGHICIPWHNEMCIRDRSLCPTMKKTPKPIRS